jgi:hypothetical protein
MIVVESHPDLKEQQMGNRKGERIPICAWTNPKPGRSFV